MKKIRTRWVTRRKAIILFVAIFVVVGIRFLVVSFADRGNGPYADGSITVTPDPPLLETCSGKVDISLAVDISGDQGALQDLRQPFKDLVSSIFPGSPNAKMAISAFYVHNSDNPDYPVLDIYQPLTTDPTALDNAIDRIGAGNLDDDGHTDWLSGLQVGAQALAADTTPNVAKLLIILSDSSPTDQSNFTAAVDEANTLKNEGIHILAAAEYTSDHGIFDQDFESISGTDTTSTDLNVDFIKANGYSDLGVALQNLAQATCGGNGIGNGGTGSGTNGNGIGNGGTGSGSGNSGTGTGKGPTPSPSPAPAPNPSPSPSPTPVPSPVPNPAPQAAPSTQPNPAPAPKAQGTQTKPPQPQPSPFYDGKQYAPGSVADNYNPTAARQGISGWWYAFIALLAIGGGSGYFVWRKRNTQAAPKTTSQNQRSKSGLKKP